MRTPPHVHLMSSLKPLMGPTKFVTWQITAADGHPTLAGALERLASGQRPAPAVQVRGPFAIIAFSPKAVPDSTALRPSVLTGQVSGSSAR
jgi:hypothetical protein